MKNTVSRSTVSKSGRSYNRGVPKAKGASKRIRQTIATNPTVMFKGKDGNNYY